MISEIIQTLKSSERPLTLNELSEVLDTEPSALEGMLDYLLLKGKIIAQNPVSIIHADEYQTFKCGGCHENPYCPTLLNQPVTYYIKENLPNI